MNKNGLLKTVLGFSSLLLLLSGTPLKASAFSLRQGDIEVSGELGLTKLTTRPFLLEPTPFETDELRQKNNFFTGPLLGIGLGYIYPLRPSHTKLHWLPYIKPMLNLRYLQQNMLGRVNEFETSLLYHDQFTLNVSSTRLMFDIDLGVFSYKRFSTYAIGGIGEGWNQLRYEDVPHNAVGGAVHLNSNTNARFAIEGGGGVSYKVDKKLTLSLEYLYANLGTNQPSVNGTLDGVSATFPAVRIPITAQSFQIVANWKI